MSFAEVSKMLCRIPHEIHITWRKKEKEKKSQEKTVWIKLVYFFFFFFISDFWWTFHPALSLSYHPLHLAWSFISCLLPLLSKVIHLFPFFLHRIFISSGQRIITVTYRKRRRIIHISTFPADYTYTHTHTQVLYTTTFLQELCSWLRLPKAIILSNLTS